MGFFIPCAMALGNSSFCPKLRSRSVWTTLLFFCSLIQSAVCQIRYTIPEELKRGSLIGNVAQDLGLDIQRLRSGRARILTRQSIQYTELKTDKGILVVNEKIDREKLCGDVTPCSFSFEVILENPMELHRLTVEITDINDNAPTFRKEEIKFEISESATLGSRFLLPSAEDADVGSNDIQKYILSTNDIFGLKQHSNPDGRKYAEMVLEKPLDRESEPRLSLKLIAVDGGAPHKSGTVNIEITVLDVNDNPPIFNQTLYKAAVSEKALKGTYITAINASDADSGSNCLITYRFSNMKEQLADVFHLDENTGIITLIGQVDYEKDKKHEVMVEATDKGGLTDSSKVMIEVLDENDNAPAINVMSFSSTVPEDAPVGTTVAIINVVDADSEQNGKIACTTDSSPPFKIKPTLTNYYALLTDAGFDRELVSHYNITVKATDSGAPALTSKTILQLRISDINDNAPIFDKKMVPRSADVGYLVTKVVAVDVDSGQNAWLSYKLQKATDRALFEVGLQNGEIRTIRQVSDKDAVKQRLSVIVEDNGQPSRSATVIVNVAVADSFPEVLSEFTDFAHDKEYNDNLTFYLVLALAVVSFLFITCLVVIISVKIYRWRQSRILYHSSLPVIPYYPPRYSDTLGTGTLQHVYNYEVCRTTDSRKSDMKTMQPMSQSLVSVDGAEADAVQLEKQPSFNISQMSTLVSDVKFPNNP
eukprot:XP_003979663.2 PREDICTED: protocadherin gamma-B1-like [Takifugu rubripes]